MENIKDKQQLSELISRSLGKIRILELTDRLHYSPEFDVANLIAITFSPQKEVAFRATWLLENLFLLQPDKYISCVDELVVKFPLLKNEGSLRHYLRIFILLTDKKAEKQIAQKIVAVDFNEVISRCFDMLIDDESPIALKVFAMELLYNLRHREDWIKDILISQIQILMDGGGPAIRARGKSIWSKLKR
ncbi:hypothetical protein KXQ82_17920 [Mucilaginibacter sp. HMF5004]|uniref:hypothetical protein n=1 Tax=Mucilaginibacter rivuli TaxID=2857527 RepID=UPI001C602DDC|nr:hypothetical protein [Mucilaginibacter rivuli]MBW4891609.1 hypothetical protein [Mucilaginibacter rivuli]